MYQERSPPQGSSSFLSLEFSIRLHSTSVSSRVTPSVEACHRRKEFIEGIAVLSLGASMLKLTYNVDKALGIFGRYLLWDPWELVWAY
jgi:hypothetical protein